MTGLPVLFEESMKSKLGDDFSRFVDSLQWAPPVSIRLNPGKKSCTTTNDQVLWSKYGRYLDKRPVFTLDPDLHAGAYYVQEASSMFLEQVFIQLLDPSAGMNILDLSAAPGGKSTHVLSLIQNNSLLVSNEVIRSRASILSENIVKWGKANVVVTNNDPKDFQSLPGFFDVIVVDAPCSGEGLFRKEPEAQDEWSPQHVELCSARQKRILSDVWPSLRENGMLVYCTCTYNSRENEDNLHWLKKEHNVEFLSLKLHNDWNIEESVSGDIRGYRFFPHRLKGEGFFLSVMRKNDPALENKTRSKKKLNFPPKKIAEELTSWLTDGETFSFFDHNGSTFGIPATHASTFDEILQHLKVVHAGTALASAKHDKLIPEHGLAMSVHLRREAFPQLALTYDDAIRYLRKDVLPFRESQRGFALVTFEDVALGWVNNVGNRFNNLYPQEWRIRMAHR